MMKNMVALVLITILAVLLAVIFTYFFIGRAPKAKSIAWGVNFSQMQAEALHLDWKKMYLSMFEDLGVKKVKLLTQWDWVEGQKGDFDFEDTDWQVQQAQSNNAQLIYVVGMKTGRWPECHVPGWAGNLSKQAQQEELLVYIKEVVTRYKDSPAITAWQAENEPLFNFGVCPWYDKDFLAKEVALIKSLDPSRPVVISDSGEQSTWFEAARMGDIVSNTLYRKLWFHITDSIGFYATFPLPPVFYYRKAQLVNYFFGKEVFCGELQAEPWAPKAFYDIPVQEQEKSMDLKQFKSNVQYAKDTGLPSFYFWGVEWWYWLKETQNQPQIWDEAKGLFASNAP